MAWWTTGGIELKQKSKFLVSVAGDFFLPNVKSVSKPSVSFDIKEYLLINHNFKYPGVAKWGDISITFIDMNGGAEPAFDTAGLLSQMINNTGYTYPHVSMHPISTGGGTPREISTPEKSSTVANAFGPGLSGKADFTAASKRNQNVLIQQINTEGKIVEAWVLVNPLIKSVKFGDLTYDSDEPVEYTLEVAYDYAIYG